MNLKQIPCQSGGIHDFDEHAPEKRCRKCDKVLIIPQPVQVRLLKSAAHVAIFGGSKGCGKSWSLLMETTRHLNNPRFGAVVFRREGTQIYGVGGLWDTAEKIYPHLGGQAFRYRGEWIFPSGAKVKFAHLALERDVNAWDGQQVPLIGFDELTLFSAKQFWYMLTINRSTCGVQPYMRATCNPDSESWVADLLAWWIDQDTGFPIPERAGKLRWFVRESGQLVWGDSRAELVRQFPLQHPKSLTFIPAKLEDNPILDKTDPGYRANLMAQELVIRQRLLDGNWKVRPEEGFKFPRDKWNTKFSQAPAGLRLVRFWDKACLIAGTMIETSAGQLPIEAVRPGDYVRTRGGYQRVLRAGVTGWTAVVASVLFSNGAVISGTQDHLVWTADNIWRSLATLAGNDYCACIQGGTSEWHARVANRCPTRRSSSSMASHIVVVQASDTSRAATWNRDGRSGISCIEPSGGFTTDLSPVAIKYTTRTRIGTITRLRILNASLAASTCSGIVRNFARQNILQRSERHNEHRPNGGGKIGTRQNTVKRAGSVGLLRGIKPFQKHLLASSVGSSLRCDGLAAKSQSIAPAFAATEQGRLAGRQLGVPVYDLTVEDEPEFFANGVLVHNSTPTGKGARTAGVLMGFLPDHLEKGLPPYWVVHVEADRWDDSTREARIRSLAETDNQMYGHVSIGVEREGGSGGSHSARMTVTGLAGYDAYSEKPLGSKSERWTPLARQQQVGNVAIVKGEWDWAGFIDELDYLSGDEAKDRAKLKDCADAAAGAFKFLCPGSTMTIQGDILASGDPDNIAEESKPLTAEEIEDLPEFWRELVQESDGLGRDSSGRDFDE